MFRCLIVKTDGYSKEQVGRVVQVRATVEGLKLGGGVLERLAEEGEKGSLRYVLGRLLAITILMVGYRYALQLLTPGSILANLDGRTQIEVEDIGEMNELFLDAKTSAGLIGANGGFDGGKMW